MSDTGCDFCGADDGESPLHAVGNRWVCDACHDRIVDNAEQLYGALVEAKSELVALYEAIYPNDESDNDTTAVIDRVIAVLREAEGK